LVPKLNDPGDPDDPDDDQKIEGEHFSVFSSTQSCIYERPEPPEPTDRTDGCLETEPTVWLDELRNVETGLEIHPLLPVPQLTNVATTVHACQTIEGDYYAVLQFLPLDPGRAVAWQDEVKVHLEAGDDTEVVITYQQIPPEPNRFAFIPIMWTGPGPRPGDNIGWVGTARCGTRRWFWRPASSGLTVSTGSSRPEPPRRLGRGATFERDQAGLDETRRASVRRSASRRPASPAVWSTNSIAPAIAA
jgi:hypothetical protein